MGLGYSFRFMFEHMLTRVDLVTQPVAYLVFGQYVTCRFIIYVLLLDIGILFGLEVVFLDFELLLELC